MHLKQIQPIVMSSYFNHDCIQILGLQSNFLVSIIYSTIGMTLLNLLYISYLLLIIRLISYLYQKNESATILWKQKGPSIMVWVKLFQRNRNRIHGLVTSILLECNTWDNFLHRFLYKLTSLRSILSAKAIWYRRIQQFQIFFSIYWVI